LIAYGIAEHVKEDGLDKVIEEGDGLTALDEQCIYAVKHLCDPPLLIRGRQEKFLPVRIFSIEPRNGGGAVKALKAESRETPREPVEITFGGGLVDEIGSIDRPTRFRRVMHFSERPLAPYHNGRATCQS
jgi:hypothetical protein